MKDLIRFEPFYGSCIFSHLGKIYLSEYKTEGDSSDVFFVDRAKSALPVNALSSPLRVQIQYTNRCNLSCPHCYVNSGVCLSDEMSDSQIKKLLHDLREFGVLQIEWSGGEVFTRKNFMDHVKFAKELGFEQTVLTNGYNIGKNFKDPSSFWSIFTMIQISIDGFGKNFNDWVGKNSWDYVKNAVDSLEKCKPEYSKLVITTTIDSKNISDLYLIGEWISARNIFWKIGKQVKNGRSSLQDQQSMLDLEQSYLEVLRLRTIFEINVVHPFDKFSGNPLFPLDWNTENGARWYMYIKANGDVYPFPYLDGVNKFKAGNVLNDSMDNLWNCDAFNLYRSVSRDDTGCHGCDLVCSMWSRSFNYFYENDLFATPPKHTNCTRLI